MSHHNKAEETKGRVKESVGVLTDDKGLEREGKVDQASAKTKRGVSKVSDKIKDAVNRDDSKR